MTRLIDLKGAIFLSLLAAFCLAVPVLNLVVPEGSGLHLPTYLVSLFGKYLAYALLAVSLDLVWGYCGILSLGHGPFFALGGYAMGMYLMRQIGARQEAGRAADDGAEGRPGAGAVLGLFLGVGAHVGAVMPAEAGMPVALVVAHEADIPVRNATRLQFGDGGAGVLVPVEQSGHCLLSHVMSP